MVVSPARANSPPRWRKRAKARPDEILDAALLEFTSRGFDAARMEDIARRAGISKAAVYLYFPSKLAVLKALIEAKVAPIAKYASAAAAAGAADPVVTLRAIALQVTSRLSDPNVVSTPRVVLSIAGRFPEIADHYREHVVDVARQAMAALIRAGIASGALRDVDPDAAVRALIGPFLFEALWTHVLRGETALGNPKQLVEQQFDVLLNGLERRT
jgi:AcrR family transcriptional regulator